MNLQLPALLHSQSKRTTFLSEGVKLCALICGICAAPLPWVYNSIVGWWLMSVITVVGLGTFGIWAFSALKNRALLDSEEHTEQMAAIALFGQNREGLPPLLKAVDQNVLTSNPDMNNNQEDGRG